MEYVVSNLRFAQVRHHILHLLRGEAARAPAREGEASEHQARSNRDCEFTKVHRLYLIIFKAVNYTRKNRVKLVDAIICACIPVRACPRETTPMQTIGTSRKRRFQTGFMAGLLAGLVASGVMILISTLW